MGRRMRKRPPLPIGSRPGEFLPGGTIPPGSGGQFTLYDLPLRYVADPRDLANSDGLGGRFGVPDFLWVAGDGNTPTVGPALTLAGSPTVGDSPYQIEGGDDLAVEDYDGASYRDSATATDPGATDNVRILSLVRIPHDMAAGDVLAGTRVAGRGWAIVAVTSTTVRLEIEGDALASTGAVTVALNSIAVLDAFIDRSGTCVIALNGTLGATVACPANSIASGSGIGVWARPGGGNVAGVGGSFFTAVWYGGTWTPATDSVIAAAHFSGLLPHQGDLGTFARNSAALWEDRNSIWHIASPGLIRGGDEIGAVFAPSRTNKVYNTINPQATTGWSVTGGTHTVVSDAAQLDTDKLAVAGPNVHQFVPGAGDEVIYGGATTSNTDDHSTSVFMRGAAGGESVDLVARDASAGTVTNLGTVVLTTSWVRYIVDGWTPGDTDEQFGLDVDAGDTVLFILPQMEENPTVTTPIPNWQTAATATALADVLTTTETLVDSQGSVECKVTPLGYSASDLSGAPRILNGGADLLLYGSATGWRAYDGSTVVINGVPSSGVENEMRTRWGNALSLTNDGSRVSVDYDGSLFGAGAVTIDTDIETRIHDLKIYRNGND